MKNCSPCSAPSRKSSAQVIVGPRVGENRVSLREVAQGFFRRVRGQRPAAIILEQPLRHAYARDIERSRKMFARMTAADILWGAAFSWTIMFGLVPKKDVFVRYAERITARPAFHRITAADDAMAAQHAAALAG